MKFERIVIIVNKKWEAAPVQSVFRAPYSAATSTSAKPLTWTTGKRYPAPNNWPDSESKYNFEYRYILRFDDLRVEFWCLADFEDTSDSGKKCPYILKTLAGQKPDLVIALGTAASVLQSAQGSVVVGCRAFMHDPQVNAKPSQPEWPANKLDVIMSSAYASAFAEIVDDLPTAWSIDVRRRLLKPSNGKGSPQVFLDPDFIAVGDVNVQDYSKYKITDPLTVDACHKADRKAKIGSIETTGALIRALTDPVPFLFLASIANELGFFNRDISDSEYTQNFVAAHNMGVVLAWLLPVLVGGYPQ